MSVNKSESNHSAKLTSSWWLGSEKDRLKIKHPIEKCLKYKVC
jgi:hypothetical protein